MSSSKKMKVLLFFALFFGATGFLFLILSCGTEYWLLAAESCSNRGDVHGDGYPREMKVFELRAAGETSRARVTPFRKSAERKNEAGK